MLSVDILGITALCCIFLLASMAILVDQTHANSQKILDKEIICTVKVPTLTMEDIKEHGKTTSTRTK